jgi:hypothetical protein
MAARSLICGERLPDLISLCNTSHTVLACIDEIPKPPFHAGFGRSGVSPAFVRRVEIGKIAGETPALPDGPHSRKTWRKL